MTTSQICLKILNPSLFTSTNDSFIPVVTGLLPSFAFLFIFPPNPSLQARLQKCEMHTSFLPRTAIYFIWFFEHTEFVKTKFRLCQKNQSLEVASIRRNTGRQKILNSVVYWINKNRRKNCDCSAAIHYFGSWFRKIGLWSPPHYPHRMFMLWVSRSEDAYPEKWYV